MPGEEQSADYDQQHSTGNFHRVQVTPESVVKGEKTLDSQRSKQERYGQSQRVDK